LQTNQTDAEKNHESKATQSEQEKKKKNL